MGTRNGHVLLKKGFTNRLMKWMKIHVSCSLALVYEGICCVLQPLHPHDSIAKVLSSWSTFFSDRPWTTISTKAPRLTGPSTISWTAWALWQTISQTSPCPLRHASPANGRRPTTCATFASTKDTTSKTALRWAAQGCPQSGADPQRQAENSCAVWGPLELSIKMYQHVLKNINDGDIFDLNLGSNPQVSSQF